MDISIDTRNLPDYSEMHAISIRNLCKSYSNEPLVVKNACMTVQKGTIYGLLGHSGCGKTTLLSCMVGLQKWDSGELLVFGKKPGAKNSGIPGKKLGYVPQELALYNYLTIFESIQFYGRLFNMKSSDISTQWKYLQNLLQLPANDRIVSQLSGGQQRRVSLSLALIHKPALLILDEPTVGLDPLLRQKIWDYLYEVVRATGTTILLTTHYIEEARFANTVAIMRMGRILAEDSPPNLLRHYQCELLEDVVLKICRKDEASIKEDQSTNNSQIEFKSPLPWKIPALFTKDEKDETSGIFRPISDSEHTKHRHLNNNNNEFNTSEASFPRNIITKCLQSLERSVALTIVFLTTFYRHPGFLTLLLCMPSIQGSITLWVMGSRPTYMNFGVVNYDVDDWSEKCDFSGNYSTDMCDISALSCKYLEQIKRDDMFSLKPFDTEADALSNVHQGNIWGYFTFYSNFSDHSRDLMLLKTLSPNETLEGSRIHVHFDYSQFVAAFYMLKHMYESYFSYLKTISQMCQFGKAHEVVSMHFRPPVYGSNDDDFTAFVMPGLTLCSLAITICCLTAMMVISDRKEKVLSRARAAGLGTAELLISHLMTQMVVTFAQIIIWDLILYFVFDFQFVGSVFLWVVFCVLIGICGTSIGLFFGMLCRDEVEGLIVGVFLFLLFVLFGGVIFPRESMSPFWQQVGFLIPSTLPSNSIRSIVVRGVGLTHPLVWPGVVALIAWSIILCFCSGLLYKYFAD